MTEINSPEGRPESLHLNSVASIRIKGLAKCNLGKDYKLAIPRAQALAPIARIYNTTQDTKYVLREPLRPPQSILPPPGNIELELELEDVPVTSANKAAYHTVYKFKMLSSGGNLKSADIPPLVLKVAEERQGRKIAMEGGMYNHMESLQGVVRVIPRCYGYFQTLVDHTQVTILPWDVGCVYPRAEFDIFRMPNAHACLSVLLLEEVGGPAKGIPKDEVKSDLKEMCNELAHLGIEYTDWGVGNILNAPQGLRGDSSSKRSGLVYGLRLVDFEDARWTNTTVEEILHEAESNMEEVATNIAESRDRMAYGVRCEKCWPCGTP